MITPTSVFYNAVMPALFMIVALLISRSKRLLDLDKGVLAIILLAGALVMWMLQLLGYT